MTEELLRFYQQRARGNDHANMAERPKLSIVHAQAEVMKQNENMRKLAGNDPGDGGRKA